MDPLTPNAFLEFSKPRHVLRSSNISHTNERREGPKSAHKSTLLTYKEADELLKKMRYGVMCFLLFKGNFTGKTELLRAVGVLSTVGSEAVTTTCVY